MEKTNQEVKDLKCPGNCIITDEKTGEKKEGILTEIIPGSDRWFCLNGPCPFGFQDEHKQHHWRGGEIPLNLPNGDNIS